MSGPFGSQHWMYASGGFYSYSIDQSLRFDAASESELSRTFASGGNRRKWTFSTWIKRTTLTPSGNDDYIFGIRTAANNASFMFLNWRAGDDLIVTGQSTLWLRSDRVFRDVGAWYHIVWSLDTDNSTASQRMRLYVNGSELTSFSTDSRSSLSGDQAVNAAAEHNIGRHPSSTGYGLGAYLAETHFIDGQAYDPSYFGETKNGIWVPKAYSGSYGTTGFYLSYANSSAIGDDLSGNTNDFTATNLAAHDVVPDSPTNNFATWNSVHRVKNGSNAATYTEGNLKAASGGNSTHVFGSFGINPTDTQGYYWEIKAISIDTARSYIGIVAPEGGDGGNASYQFAKKFVLNRNDDLYGNDGSGGSVVSYTSWTTNDILMVAYKNGKIWIGKNGTWMNSGNPAAGTGDIVAQDGGRPSDRGDVTWFPYAGYNSTYTANFGQEGTFAGTETAGGNSDENGYGDFKYSVPSGFLAMCSANLPEATIGPNSATQADDNFNTVLYTGDGTNGQAITGVGHQPNFLWIKSRSGTAYHELHDSVRGAGKRLFANDTAAESDVGTVSSFDSDGFTVSRNSAYDGTNQNGVTFVGWSWKAGGTAVSNTDGSITSSVSVNQDAGFSIVSYTGTGSAATVGHGLSSAPEVIITKNRDDSGNWMVYHANIASDAETDYINLNLTNAAADGASVWNDTAPTSSIFSVGTNGNSNGSSDDIIAYCFHSVEGYSKIGSFVGNGSTDGTFIFTGFRPAWFLVRRSSAASNWTIFDNKRGPFNEIVNSIDANLSNAEETGTSVNDVDFVSNGIKIREDNGDLNASGGTIIYLAFAEAPFKYANAR